MFAADKTLRSAYRRLHESLAPAAPAELSARAEALDRALVDHGITFSLSGQERLERGIVQRVRALEAFLADIYGDQQQQRAIRPACVSPIPTGATTSSLPVPASAERANLAVMADYADLATAYETWSALAADGDQASTR